MLASVQGPLTAATTTRPASSRALRRRSLANLVRMGHCAPTVMKTLLDAYRTDAPWLVRLTAGLPGGIGNCRNECGGITAPLVLLGLRHARDPDVAGVPVVVSKGSALLQAFHARHGTVSCRDILGDARVPLPCVGVVRIAPERRRRRGPGVDVAQFLVGERQEGQRGSPPARTHPIEPLDLQETPARDVEAAGRGCGGGEHVE